MAKSGKSTGHNRPPEDDSHIIRSDNATNVNVKMYGNTIGKSEKSEEKREDNAVRSDPSTYPGGEKPEGP